MRSATTNAGGESTPVCGAAHGAGVRNDLTVKCCGDDAARQRKVLEKQKQGNKRLRRFGKVDPLRRRSSPR